MASVTTLGLGKTMKRKLYSVGIYSAEEFKNIGSQSMKLTFDEIKNIAGIPIDHSFLKYKKELTESDTMEVRYIIPADDRRMISKVYEESWKSAYKGIIPQEYLDSIPEGRWVPNLDKQGWRTLVCIDNGKIVGTSSFCKSRFEQFQGWGEIISIYLLPDCIGGI